MGVHFSQGSTAGLDVLHQHSVCSATSFKSIPAQWDRQGGLYSFTRYILELGTHAHAPAACKRSTQITCGAPCLLVFDGRLLFVSHSLRWFLQVCWVWLQYKGFAGSQVLAVFTLKVLHWLRFIRGWAVWSSGGVMTK